MIVRIVQSRQELWHSHRLRMLCARAHRKWVVRAYPTESKLSRLAWDRRRRRRIRERRKKEDKCKSPRALFFHPDRKRPDQLGPALSIARVLLPRRRCENPRFTSSSSNTIIEKWRSGSVSSLATATECKLVISWSLVRTRELADRNKDAETGGQVGRLHSGNKQNVRAHEYRLVGFLPFFQYKIPDNILEKESPRVTELHQI